MLQRASQATVLRVCCIICANTLRTNLTKAYTYNMYNTYAQGSAGPKRSPKDSFSSKAIRVECTKTMSWESCMLSPQHNRRHKGQLLLISPRSGLPYQGTLRTLWAHQVLILRACMQFCGPLTRGPALF